MGSRLLHIAVAASALAAFSTAAIKTPTIPLYPALHSKHDLTDFTHLTPRRPAVDGAPLFYAQDESSVAGSTITQAFMTPQFKRHSIVLDHSHYVQDVRMSGTGDLAISFNDKNAYDHCHREWAVDGGLIFVTHTPGCGGYDDGERCYFMAEDLEWDHENSMVKASGDALNLSDAVHKYKLSFGVIQPDGEDDSDISPSCNPAGLDEHGLPTECEGLDFDDRLDSTLGYTDATWELDESILDYHIQDAAKSSLDKRQETNPVKDFLSNFAEALDNHTSNTIDFLNDEFETTIPFYFRKDRMLIPPRFSDCQNHEGASNPCRPKDARLRVVKSPFSAGDDILLGAFGSTTRTGRGSKRRDIKYHCVDCGLEGTIIVSGEVTVTPFEGIIGGHIQMETSLKLGVKLGIEGSMSHEYNSPEMTIWEAELPGIDIPGTIVIEPQAAVAAQVTADTAIVGNFLGGGEWTFARMVLKYDFETRKTTLQHYDPVVVPTLEMNGDVRTQAVLALPFVLSFDVRLFNGGCKLCKWGIALNVLPTTKAITHTGGTFGIDETNGTVTGVVTVANNCEGISVELIDHTVIDATVTVAGNTITDTLGEIGPKTILQKCIPFTGDLNRRAALQSRAKSLPDLASEPSEIKDFMDEISSKGLIGKSTPFKPILPRSTKNAIAYEPLNEEGSGLRISACADGSVRLLPASLEDEDNECDDTWIYLNGNVIADSAKRHLHYYENSMSEVGVSRLRLSGGNGIIPKGARHVLLHPLQSDGSMIALDKSKGAFYPAYCTYADKKQPPRLFLVEDAQSGVETLMKESLKGSVTGARVSNCALISIVHR